MTKIAFIDIDGTMLDFSKSMIEPTQNTINAFKKFRENGNLLICATSRSKLPISVHKEWFDGFVLNNGQYIEYKNNVLLNNIFNCDQITFLHNIFKENNAGSSFHGVNGSWIAPEHIEHAIKHAMHYGNKKEDIEKLALPFVLNEIEASAITASFDNEKDMRNVEKALPEEWEIHAYYDPNDLRIDIHLPGHTKGSSCMKVVAFAQLTQADSYAFGDGINDIEMLELVGCGVAMGNADDKVKTIADEVTDDLFNDGLAKAFNKLFDLNLDIK